MQNYYEVLELRSNASADDIKKSYRNLARKEHPDRHNTKPAEVQSLHQERFKAIQQAYEVLSDPELKELYDYLLTEGSAATADAVFKDSASLQVVRSKLAKKKSKEVDGVDARAAAAAAFFPRSSSRTTKTEPAAHVRKPRFMFPSVVAISPDKKLYKDLEGDELLHVLIIAMNRTDSLNLIWALHNYKSDYDFPERIPTIYSIYHPNYPEKKIKYQIWYHDLYAFPRVDQSLLKLIDTILILGEDTSSTVAAMQEIRGSHYYATEPLTAELNRLMMPFSDAHPELDAFFRTGIPGGNNAKSIAHFVFEILDRSHEKFPKTIISVPASMASGPKKSPTPVKIEEDGGYDLPQSHCLIM